MTAKKTGEKKVGSAKKRVAIQKAKAGEPIILEVTKEVFFLNTVFFEANGVAIGDKIEVSEATVAELKFPDGHPFATPKDAKKVEKVGGVAPKAPSKIVCPIAIIKGEEFVRVYPKGQEEEAQEFLQKDPNRVAVSPKEIASITVSWRENEKKKDSDTGKLMDTGRLITKSHTFTEKDNGEDWFKQARRLANEGVRRSCVVKLK